jgi:hypothetical protein
MSKIVEVPSRLDKRGFEEFVKKLHSLFEEDIQEKADNIIFDLRGLTWLEPMEAMCLPIAAQWICSKIDIKTKPEFWVWVGKKDPGKRTLHPYFSFLLPLGILHYLVKKGFKVTKYPDKENLSLSEPFTPESFNTFGDKETNITVTLILNLTQIDEVAGYFATRLKNIDWLDEGKKGILCNIIVNELCSNVVMHAFSNVRDEVKMGIVAVRLLRNFINILIVDAGPGIAEALRGKYERDKGRKAEGSEIIRYAFEKGTSSRDKSINPNAGFSLYEVFRAVQRWEKDIPELQMVSKIQFRVRSRTSEVHLLPEGIPDRNDLLDFPGTQIKIVLPARRAKQIRLEL